MGKRGQVIQAQVLEIMRRHDGPQSAYDILGQMKDSNAKIAPPTVYRALAALMDQGLVHRLETLNAYVRCQCSEHQQPSILSICDDCGTVEERVDPGLLSDLTTLLGKTGFAAKRHVIEVYGTCAACGPGQTVQ